MRIGDALPGTELQCLPLDCSQHAAKLLTRQLGEARAHLGLRRRWQPKQLPVRRSDAQKFGEEARGVWATPDRQEVDQLDEQPRLPVARVANDADQLLETRQKAIVTDAQQRAARHVADAGRLDHHGCRPTFGEAAVPIDHITGDEAVAEARQGTMAGTQVRLPSSSEPTCTG